MNNNEIFNYIFIYLSCTFSGKYKTQLYDSGRGDWLPSSPGIGMHVEVFINILRCGQLLLLFRLRIQWVKLSYLGFIHTKEDSLSQLKTLGNIPFV